MPTNSLEDKVRLPAVTTYVYNSNKQNYYHAKMQ